MPSNPSAGWYPAPDEEGLRYWDGQQWSEHRAHSSPPEAEPTVKLPIGVPVAPPASSTGGARPPWFRRGWVMGVGGLVLGLVVGAVGSSSGDANPPSQPLAAPAATTTVTATPQVTATVTAKPRPAATVTVTAQPKPAKHRARSQVGSEPASTGDTFVIPDETGKGLQAAQDDLQAVSGNPFFYSDSTDATGADRMQLLDSDWQVCSQRPAAGSTVRDDAENVVFAVVRVTENCP